MYKQPFKYSNSAVFGDIAIQFQCQKVMHGGCTVTLLRHNDVVLPFKDHWMARGKIVMPSCFMLVTYNDYTMFM